MRGKLAIAIHGIGKPEPATLQTGNFIAGNWQAGATLGQASQNLPQPNLGPAGPDATPKNLKFPSQTLLVQRQPHTPEAVWEKTHP